MKDGLKFKMNKKAQAVVVGLMIAVFVFLATVAMMKPLKDNIVIARNSDNLDCANESISMGVAATCLIVDLYLPYFVGVVLASGAGFVFVRRAQTVG